MGNRLFTASWPICTLSRLSVADDNLPDPTWTPGIYDADTDAAVESATSLESQVEEGSCIISLVSIVAGVSLTAGPVIRNITIRNTPARGPP